MSETNFLTIFKDRARGKGAFRSLRSSLYERRSQLGFRDIIMSMLQGDLGEGSLKEEEFELGSE